MQYLISNYSTLYFIVITVLSCLITLFTIPSIIQVSKIRHLYDDLGHFRKQHDHGIPRLGGVAIFVSFTITSLMFSMTDRSLPINYLLTSCIILFAMGLKDDLSGVNSNTKLIIQLIAGSILVILGNVRVTNAFGIFGIYQMSYFSSVILSIFLIVLIVNAFNLIDGIDGLAGATGIIVSGTFAGLFIYMHQFQLAAVSLAMLGAILGFLKFNITPAKIFMGDTGALLIGLISAIMVIKFIELNDSAVPSPLKFYSSPLIALTILMGPIFDTIRVFIIRIYSGISPFTADRNHMHHRLLTIGFTHLQSTLIISICNLICIATVLILHHYSNSFLFFLIVSIAICINLIVSIAIRANNRNELAFPNSLIKINQD
jgi:UDP-GlcNAc:undecaprenyl-phosphate/decaprenyl-phosphate GlcNAc-1-phosphate transferase